MPVPPRSPNRLRWLVVVAALSFSVVLYGVVVLFLSSQPASVPAVAGAAMIRVVLLALGLASLAGALALTPRAPDGALPGRRLAPDAFFKRSLVALAIAESAAVYGLVAFLVGRRVVDFGVLAAGALALMLLHVLPQGLRYWADGDGPQAGAGPGPLGPS